MSLDVFDASIRNADAEVARNAARDLPSGFSENFDVSLRSATEWNNSNNYAFARERALASFYDDVRDKTGETLPLYGLGGAVSLDELNDKLTKLPGREAESGYQPLTENSINEMTLRRMARAHGDAEAIAARERNWGGTAGMLLGGLVGSLADPVTQATLPLGGAGELGVAMRALEFAGIAGGAQAGTAALSYGTREAAVPGSSKEIPGEIASAALFGGALGGAFGMLGKFLKASERPLPTSVREDVNAGASEAQFGAANVFDGAAGEAANRDAVTAAAGAITRGEAVTAGEAFDAAHVVGFAERAGAKDAGEIAAAGDRAQRPLTHDVMPETERFDPLPRESEDAGSYWERRAAEASPEERVAMGITDDATPTPALPREREKGTAGDAVAARPPPTAPDPLDLAMRGELTAEKASAIAKDLAAQQRSVEDEIFKGRADEWRKLNKQSDRAWNNADDAKAKAIDEKIAKLEREVGLTDADENWLNGQGWETHSVPDHWKDLARNLHDIEFGGQDAVGVSASEVRYLPKSSDWSNMSSAQQQSVITLLSAMNAEKAAGRDPMAFLKDVFAERIRRYGGGADAHEVAQYQMEELANLLRNPIKREKPVDLPRLASPEPREQIPARDLPPEEMAKLVADPATDQAVLRNLDRLRLENVDRDFTESVRLPDGSTQLVTRKLEDVLDEIDGFEKAGKELLACATGMMAAE